MSTKETPVSATRLTLPMSGVVGLTTMIVGLLGATATGAWTAARAFARIEQKLEAVTEEKLRSRFYTRQEMVRYHLDLERALQRAGSAVNFPPPRDPSEIP